MPCLPFAAECCRAFRLGFLLPGCYNYLYRMKALDAIRTSGKRGHGGREREGGERVGNKACVPLCGRTQAFGLRLRQWGGGFCFPEIPFHADGRYPKSLIGKNFCAYLLELRNSSASFKGIRKALIDTLLDGYESARYGTGVSTGPPPGAAPAGLAGLASRCALGRGWQGLFCLRPGLWETRIPEVPGCSERAGKPVSVSVRACGCWGMLGASWASVVCHGGVSKDGFWGRKPACVRQAVHTSLCFQVCFFTASRCILGLVFWSHPHSCLHLLSQGLWGGAASFPRRDGASLCRTKARAGSSQRQHQSAAKDLTLSPEVSSPATIQVTYLPSSQKSKRAKHFLELKSFKDNYNTLESTL